MANMIVSKFADAGFGRNQQLSALANAIAESALDPAARANSPDDSVGLFQISRRALGSGRTVQELEDAGTNISLVIEAAKKASDFAAGATLQDAVAVFVRKVMRPADVPGQMARRLKIAESLQTSA
jgi:hypothetical protein